jgi:hypothetical protein
MRTLCLLFASFLFAAPALAYDVEFCFEIQTNFTDINGGDFWTTNDNRSAHGVRVQIIELNDPGTADNVTVFDGFAEPDGCHTETLDWVEEYGVRARSEAEVNGIDVIVYKEDVWSPETYAWSFYGTSSPFVPSANETITLEISATTASAQLAVGSWFMWRNTLGLDFTDSQDDLVYFDEDCCKINSSGEIFAPSFRKFIIAHETGHAVAYRRDDHASVDKSYNANEDSCDGDGKDQDKHGQTTKEYQSAAASEGMADFMSAWAWNQKTDATCEYERHYQSDWDLDNDLDGPATGVVSCEAKPVPETETLAFNTNPDWLEHLVNAADSAGCAGTLDNRGTQFDWLRYFWDMLTDEGLEPEEILDIWDAADPHTWNSTDLGSAGNDPIARIEAAADVVPAACSGLTCFGDEHDNQKMNGQDH